jgi:hypothetical protein
MAYNARDLPGMLALMLDSAAIDMLGTGEHVGRRVYARKHGWFHHNLFPRSTASPPTRPGRRPSMPVSRSCWCRARAMASSR